MQLHCQDRACQKGALGQEHTALCILSSHEQCEEKHIPVYSRKSISSACE